MSGIAFCRKTLRVLETLKLGKWLLGTSDRRGQDKSHKVRPVGWGWKHQQIPMTLQTLRMPRTTCDFRQHDIVAQLLTPCGSTQ